MNRFNFEWNSKKSRVNYLKHGITFESAQYAFDDPGRIIAIDHKHSTEKETRYFCYGLYHDMVLTVRFTFRNGVIRIFGAGYWREGREIYYEKHKIF